MATSSRMVGLILASFGFVGIQARAEEPAAPAAEVSYYKQVRPILQANCQGCHQPAKAAGAYIMTDFTRLLAGGETGEAAVVPGNPDGSALVVQITPANGQAAMPKGKAPLADADIQLIRSWIAQGAKDDTPANAVQRYDADHPPVYSRQPVVTALDYSPDGQLLAVSGFHEVLLHKADGSGLVARLIGLSERIESARFSPDGKRLAVTGGLPCRMGELQLWNVETKTLELSIPITADTVYGASWSPDGTLVAIGCADKTVRGFNSSTGEQVFYSGAHDDWAQDTVFSTDGSLLVSVGRDMSTKLYDVKTQRFIDNVTSITPGALKGGLSALGRNPARDEILVGGSDGVPRIYRMQRLTKRVIGDDANLIRKFPAMRGRIFSVDYSPDGKRIVAASSLDGKGQVFTYAAEFDSAVPEEISAIVQKVGYTAEEQAKLEAFLTADVKLLTQTEVPVAIYAVAYAPDGNSITAAGADGVLRVINPADGTIARETPTVTADPNAGRAGSEIAAQAAEAADSNEYFSDESLPSGATVTAIDVQPASIEIGRKFGYAQLLVTATLNTGDRVDVTRMSAISANGDAVRVTRGGRVHARADGTGTVTIAVGDQSLQVPFTVSGVGAQTPMNFVRDVNPVISRLGCNAGTCHGAKDGKNGFKLSLRGYDPIFDVRSFTDDLASRRVNLASPDDSLMLLKATGAVPHVGGQLTRPGHPYYETIRQWIAEGAVLDQNVARVAKIEVQPQDPVIQQIGAKQQMRIVATYTDGTSRDVTGEAFIESGNTEVAEMNRHGMATTVRRGEAPLLARFEGSYAATTITSMGDRSGFVWEAPETWSEIDKLVAAKWERLKIRPSGLCDNDEFLRRAYLDLTGLPPTAEALRAFLADPRETRTKRDAVIDQLIGSEEYITYWTNKWADLLQVNSKFLGVEGATAFRDWIRGQIAANTPYDQFCREVLTASGSNKEHPAASYYKILRTPDATMENTTHLFLGVRFNCNKCHDHPFERWTQDQYYQTSAFFARLGLQRDPNNAAGDIGGTAVEGAKPLWEVVFEKPEGETVHLRTNAVTPPTVPYDAQIPMGESTSRRDQIAAWITSPENDYFARSYVNRVWGYLLGVGLIEPLDDIRAGNPASNPALLDHMTRSFIESGFNVRELVRAIAKSRVYQLSIAANEWNADDVRNYARAVPKRLPAETLYDAIYTVTGAKMQIPGVPEGTRAAAIPDAGVELADRFLANLGRPARESACECERSSGLQLGPVMALMNGPTVSEAISQPENAISQLVASTANDAALVNEIFLRVLNRPARSEEVQATVALMQTLQSEHDGLVSSLAAYREQIRPIVEENERKRVAAVAAAELERDAYAESIRAREEQAEAERQARIAAAMQALADYETALPARIAAWEATVSVTATPWTTLDPSDLKTSTRANIAKQPDLSVLASGPNDRVGNYEIAAATALQGITGLKLEVLTDPSLPANGPGRAGSGNFVLTELKVTAASPDKPEEVTNIELQNAKADISQDGFNVAAAIDGVIAGDNGWALGAGVGSSHVATFEFKQPLTIAGAAQLKFVMEQHYPDRTHSIGKFRLSVTTATGPFENGLPANILEIVKISERFRTDEQRTVLADYFKSFDDDLKAKQKALADAQQPRPEDPQLTALKTKVTELMQPLPIDPQLARLERSVQLSGDQLQNARLTTAQDLSWALINSPAFLF
ncbi:MAG: DUF1549 domain-containing protein, partial [Planctomycetaceae bacterium]|nr:DUF1549 domain-containing protein [Planctomycetaceae bacterium]